MALSLRPQNIKKGVAWYYEDRGGIEIYHHCGIGEVKSIAIPWRKIMKSVERYKKSRKSKR